LFFKWPFKIRTALNKNGNGVIIDSYGLLHIIDFNQISLQTDRVPVKERSYKIDLCPEITDNSCFNILLDNEKTIEKTRKKS